MSEVEHYNKSIRITEEEEKLIYYLYNHLLLIYDDKTKLKGIVDRLYKAPKFHIERHLK